jgi:hypothetical protein
METIAAGTVPVDQIVDELFSEHGLRQLIGDRGVACFALARPELSKNFFQQLIQNVDTIDATTRNYIAFIVFHGSQLSTVSPDYEIMRNQKYEVLGISRSFIQNNGSRERRDVLEFDDKFSHKIRSAPQEAPVNEIARSMGLATNAILERFNIQERLLPCLLFAEASRREPQIVRIDPERPTESLYSEILAPLSDEFRSLRTHWERRRRLKTRYQDLSNAEIAVRTFPARMATGIGFGKYQIEDS